MSIWVSGTKWASSESVEMWTILRKNFGLLSNELLASQALWNTETDLMIAPAREKSTAIRVKTTTSDEDNVYALLVKKDV